MEHTKKRSIGISIAETELPRLMDVRRKATDALHEATYAKREAEERITKTLFKTNRFDLLTVNWRKLERETR